jgi:hypothetical protein
LSAGLSDGAALERDDRRQAQPLRHCGIPAEPME